MSDAILYFVLPLLVIAAAYLGKVALSDADAFKRIAGAALSVIGITGAVVLAYIGGVFLALHMAVGAAGDHSDAVTKAVHSVLPPTTSIWAFLFFALVVLLLTVITELRAQNRSSRKGPQNDETEQRRKE